MKSVSFFLIILFVLIGSLCQASETNEELTRALVVVRLINQIKWQQDDFNQKSTNAYQLCIFDDSRTYRIFNQSLKEVKINDLPIMVKNVTEKEKVSYCHALYTPKPNKYIIEWLVANNLKNKSILVTEKKGFAEKGVHLNIYLNEEGYFDFELNPDAFENSVHDINSELFRLGNVFRGNLAKRIKTLRTLINNTEWPKGAIVREKFQLCAYPNNSFATFAEYFLADSDLKGLKVVLNVIDSVDSDESLRHCNTLLLSENDKSHINWLMQNRKKHEVLLISNALGSESNGAHYSLKFHDDPQVRRFGINLIAFGITNHIPNYQLFNSAIMIKNDYPLVSNLLTEIIELTQWPETLKSSKNKDNIEFLNFCNYQNDIDLNTLKSFLPTKLQNNKRIVYNEIKGSNFDVDCDLIFSGTSSNGENNYLLIKKQFPKALLISNQLTKVEKIANQSFIHFNLSLKPKIIIIEAFLNNLKNSRFTLDKKLLSSVEIIGGNSND